MYISSLNEIASNPFFNDSQKSVTNNNLMFENVFNSALDDVASNEKSLEQAQYLLSTGQIEDAHTVPVASSMAQLSVDFLVQLRNKALDSYNELMRISL